jgi:hypothetical protein
LSVDFSTSDGDFKWQGVQSHGGAAVRRYLPGILYLYCFYTVTQLLEYHTDLQLREVET